MSTTVFILGAGASKQAGVPIMFEFLDTAYKLWQIGEIVDSDKSFENVFKGISALQRVHSKSELDTNNIESLFATFEMAKLLNKFPLFDTEGINNLTSSLKKLIVRTIETTLILPVDKLHVYPPSPYGYFIHLLKFLTSDAKPKQSISVLTLNYDLAIDYALHHEGYDVDYGLSENTDPHKIKLYKLHGSLNWSYCEKCKEIVPVSLQQFFQHYNFNLHPGLTGTKIQLGENLNKFKHNDHQLSNEVTIIPPTWNKADYHKTISLVWSKAAYELEQAENIFIIGYSLPESDYFFKSLYSLGTVGDKNLQRFWVYNPDNSGNVENRFLKLLGSSAKARFRYSPLDFEKAIADIELNMK